MKKAPLKVYKLLLKYFPRICVDILVANDKGEFLLGKRNNKPAKGFYYPFGGSMLKGEKTIDSVRRVLKNELGDIKVGPITYLGYTYLIIENQHDVTFIHTAKYVSGKVKLDSQHSNYKWSKVIPKQYRKPIR